MIIVPGHCIKCGTSITRGKVASHKYQHLKFEMSDGGGMAIGICSNCDLEEAEWPEAMKLYNEYMKLQVPSWKEDKRTIVRLIERENVAELRLKMQGGRCMGCHNPITDKYVITNGVIMHERCNLPRPMPFVQRKAEVETRAKLARENQERAKRVS